MKRRAWLTPGVSVACGLAVTAAPKCPLCIAGYLSLAGIGASGAGVVAVVLRPALITAAAASLGVWLLGLWWLARARRADRCRSRVLATKQGQPVTTS